MMNKLKFIYNYLKFAKNQKRTDVIFEFLDAVRNMPEKRELLAHYEKQYLENSGFRQMWEERYSPELSRELLKKMPAGSFGREFLVFLDKYNLDLNFYPQIEIRSAIDYFTLRLYKTHDMYHVLLAEDISHRAELAVQAFTLAQTKSALPAIILSAGILHETQNASLDVIGHFDEMFRLYQLGLAIPPIYAVRLEEYLQYPVEDVRKILKLDQTGKKVNFHEAILD